MTLTLTICSCQCKFFIDPRLFDQNVFTEKHFDCGFFFGHGFFLAMDFFDHENIGPQEISLPEIPFIHNATG